MPLQYFVFEMHSLRCLIVDDHALFRSGLCLVLQAGLPNVEVLEAASMEQAVRVTGEPPDLVLLDVQLQGVNGLEGLGLLQQRWPNVPVVMLSSLVEPDTIALALSRGARAFVSKGDTSARIIEVIKQSLVQPIAPNDRKRSRTPSAVAASQSPRLTPRQCEVLDLLCQGLPNKMIARRLVVSEFTVRGHVQAILGLLGVSSRSQATFAARQHKLIG
ncbi:MAG: two component transcriptional regulator LuxR family [Comamonadaceae bacterium]|nr:MAG: two component transcriptional regulator LuxR family [Comamonadaceae bacterium]